MKITVLCNTDSLSLPVLHFLHNSGLLLEVGLLEKNAALLLPAIQSTGISNIKQFNSDGWKSSLQHWLSATQPDMVWVFGFPWRIPSNILAIPANGFYNFHFGTLPQYKGADPIFWQIRNNETKSNLTIHLMTGQVDEGPIVLTHEIALTPGENYGLLCSRMGAMAVAAVEKLLDLYRSNNLIGQPQQTAASLFYHKPGQADLCVNWEEQTATQIMCLVNATNPKYGGASAWIRNMEIRMLEVIPATMNNAITETTPGTIVHADDVYGLIVACKNKTFLRINIVQMAEGYFSGTRLFSMGICTGEQFTPMKTPLETIHP